MIQVMLRRRRIRMSMAANNPRRRAFVGLAASNFPVRITIKTMLSIPRTISSIVSVSRAIRFSSTAVRPEPPEPSSTARSSRDESALGGWAVRRSRGRSSGGHSRMVVGI